MTLKAFKAAAEAPEPYVFDLDREVAAFYRDYPEQKKRIFFIDASTMPGEIYRGDETDLDEIADLLSSNGALMKDNEAALQDGSLSNTYASRHYSCVLMNTAAKDQLTLLDPAAATDMSDVFSFDHEVGHLLCKDGSDSFNLKECVADAYATLRYFQRFGKESALIKNLTAARAVEMISGWEGGHFTAPVVEKIIADSQKTDFSALTPAETVAVAQRYAVENALDAQFVKYITDDFKALRFDVHEMIRGNFRTLHALGEFVLKTDIPEEFKWGAAAIRTLLDGNIAFDGIRLPKPEGREWTGLRQALDARTAKSAQSQPKLIIPRL